VGALEDIGVAARGSINKEACNTEHICRVVNRERGMHTIARGLSVRKRGMRTAETQGADEEGKGGGRRVELTTG
jgi:hypothetical protein